MNPFRRPTPTDALHKAVDDQRTKISALQQERAALQLFASNREETVSALYGAVDTLQAEAADKIERGIRDVARGKARANAVLQDLLMPEYGAMTDRQRAAALVAFVGSDPVKAVLAEHVAAAVPAGPDADERARKVVKLTADIEAAAIREEIALREIEAATGTYADRRADADPRIVLAAEMA